jgi:hypothetical protein
VTATTSGAREMPPLDVFWRVPSQMTGEGLEPSTNGLTCLIGFHRPPWHITTCDHRNPLWRIAYGGFAPRLGALRWRGNRVFGRRTAIDSARPGASGDTSGGSMSSPVRRRWRGCGRPSLATTGAVNRVVGVGQDDDAPACDGRTNELTRPVGRRRHAEGSSFVRSPTTNPAASTP